MQIDGATLQGLKPEDISDIVPGATRVETKLLLRGIKDMTAVAEISLHNVSTDNEGLLRQLNTWFPGKFRAASGNPLYAHDETKVVLATHKVSSVP